MKIFVGNMAFSMTVEELQVLFEEFGTVSKATLAVNRETGRLRGFAFVEMPDDAQAERAIAKLNGTVQCGRKISVSRALGKERN